MFEARREIALLVCAFGSAAARVAQGGARVDPASHSGRTVRVVGVVRDDTNAIALPGVPVEVVGTSQVVYTDVDGRYVLQVRPARIT